MFWRGQTLCESRGVVQRIDWRSNANTSAETTGPQPKVHVLGNEEIAEAAEIEKSTALKRDGRRWKRKLCDRRVG